MLRLGIVDFDSSHSIEFTRRFNQVGVAADQFVSGARVVAGWPGDWNMSPERREMYTLQVTASGVEIVDSLEQLAGKVDAVLVLSVCGAAHLSRIRWLLERRLPVFIDKPLCATVNEAQEILQLAATSGVLAWQASAMRFTDDMVELKSQLESLGPIQGLVSHGPGWQHAGNPGLLHYGVHSVEQAYALMGSGCREVSCHFEPQGDVVTGVWEGGRQVTIRTLRTGSTAYGLLTFHEQGIVYTATSTRNSYRNLCQAIVNAFNTGVAPVSLAESVEVMKFMCAANDSALSGGKPISLGNSP